MTKEDLFAAIGTVSEERLAKHEKEHKGNGQRILLHCALVAAVIAVLAASVFAIPSVRNYFLGGKTEMNSKGGVYGAEYGVEDCYYDDQYSVYLDISVSPKAPVTIETYYIPMELAENWTLCEGSFANEAVASYAWDNYDIGAYVLFDQDLASYYNSSYPYDYVNVDPGTLVSETTQEHEGQTFYRVEVAPNDTEKRGSLYIYWSDGEYIFNINCPATLTDEMVYRIIDSLAPVEDVSLYCRPNDSEAYEMEYPAFTRYDYPSYLPEDFELWVGDIYSGYASAIWRKDYNVFVFYSQCTWACNATYYIEWERSVEKCPREIVQIGENTVTIYDDNGEYDAYWEADGFNYHVGITQSKSYDAKAELAKIIESVQTVEDFTPYLKELE